MDQNNQEWELLILTQITGKKLKENFFFWKDFCFIWEGVMGGFFVGEK